MRPIMSFGRMTVSSDNASLQLAFLSGSEGAMPDIPLGVANAIAANVIATDAIAEDIAWLFTANNGQEISLDDATLLDFCEPTHSPTSQVSGASFLDPSALESEVPDTRGKAPPQKKVSNLPASAFPILPLLTLISQGDHIFPVLVVHYGLEDFALFRTPCQKCS